jgi:hypothetical protein
VLGGLGGPGGGRSGGVRGPGDARAHGKGGGEVDGHQEGPGDQVVHGGDLDECCPFEAKRRNHLGLAMSLGSGERGLLGLAWRPFYPRES